VKHQDRVSLVLLRHRHSCAIASPTWTSLNSLAFDLSAKPGQGTAGTRQRERATPPV
jgi:hypothetical protein